MKNTYYRAQGRLLAIILSLAVAFAWIIPASLAVYAEDDTPAAGEVTENAVEMQSTSIGGVTYFFADTAGVAEDAVYHATVRGRGGSTVYDFKKSDLKQVADTEVYYAVVTGVTELSGTLYGYGGGEAKSYKKVYESLGAETDDSCDTVTSATKFTSVHAKDIPSLTEFGTDAAGDKAITGVILGRTSKTVDASLYVEASLLKAAGKSLTDAQKAALDITLKANPMNAPSGTVIAAAAGKAEYVNSKYGATEFNIYPDESVEGYVWSEYWDSVYAATVSDGTSVIGGVHWIDLYGEAATAGPHYNKVEFELNNGKVPETNPNGATVNRFAKFFDENGILKDGKYTVRIYAEGYDAVEATIEVTAQADAKAAKAAAAEITEEGCTSDSYAAVKEALENLKSAEDSKSAGGIKAAADALDAAVAAAVPKEKTSVTVTPLSKSYKASALKKKNASFQLKAAVSSGAAASFKQVSSSNKKVSVNSKGKVTVKKGVKKGNYILKVKVTAPATDTALSGSKTAKITIKVK